MFTMTSDKYVFVPLNNPYNYPPTMGNAQEQALGTDKFIQDQALYQKYNTVVAA